MSLELTLLMAFVGMIFLSSLGGENGLNAQFVDSSSSLALRLEKKLTTGKCFQIGVGGGGNTCGGPGVLWQGE